MIHNAAVVLAGDIGGTNARFALFVDGEFQPDTFQAIPVGDYSDLADVVDVYVRLVGGHSIDQASFAVASTANYRDEINLTNADLRFSISGLRRRFSMCRAKVVNDFTAAALGVICLSKDSLHLMHNGAEIHDGTSAEDGQSTLAGPCAVIGPGTGLGVSGLLHTGEYWLPLQGQGGHVTMGAQNDRELLILRHMVGALGHVSAERYLSGTGIVSVYESICAVENSPLIYQCAEQITAAAINGTCAICSEVMSLFCKYLGIVSGDLALTLGSTGGIYIAGGIVPKLGDFFLQSSFLENLHNKGRFSDFVAAMPVNVVTGGEPALYGAYNSLASQYDQLGHADGVG